ncbi:zinc ribbon domain-containing protein YjdM [Flavobacterium aurantiibacter]|uniref:PhnA protein n=1 Tax=Flavobacterium aurantiibacter TaxID=2023067 RepID=A0A255ZAW7_9FLAO|nr:zinc ribbon domain-containing protein YjdM [Flavobacterium aurantiibacter]OYQ38606.1 PhnA protein [Flavobacterium aurantiibacter]
MEVKDTNGTLLQDGDTVTVIKDLKVKGSSAVIKRGTVVKNIRLTDDPAEIDCRVNKVAMVLRTEFVKKA